MGKDKLEHVTHLTNYSKLFELCVEKFAYVCLFYFYIVCHNISQVQVVLWRRTG